MRALEHLEENKKKKKNFQDDEPDDMEETLELPSYEPINTAESVFDKNAAEKTGGINTAPSVFDKDVVFKI